MHKTKQSSFCATAKQKSEHVLKIKDFIWNRLSRLLPKLSNLSCKLINIYTKWSLQSNWAWWGFKVRDFRWRFGIRSTPKLLFRFLFLWGSVVLSHFPVHWEVLGNVLDEESHSIASGQTACKRIQCLGRRGCTLRILSRVQIYNLG